MPPAHCDPERRSYYRHLSAGNVICRPGAWIHSPDLWSGEILDVSFEGISVCLVRRFEPGTRLVFEVFSSSGRPLRTTVVEVVRVQSFSDRWQHGCRLDTPLEREELRALLSREDPSPPATTAAQTASTLRRSLFFPFVNLLNER